MKIHENDLNVSKILDVKKGRIPPATPKCTNRHSDCFVYVLSGFAEYTFEGKSYIASKGNIICLTHKSNYSIKVTDENYTFIFIDFLFENSSETIYENAVYNSKSLSMLKSSFENLYHLWKTGNFSDKIYCKSILYTIYSEIVKACFAQYLTFSKQQQIEHIASYIHENLSDSELSVKKLSAMCNISEVHFRRVFSLMYHISPIKFITLAKINKAKELLMDENYTIAEISKSCGFENAYYFSKVFKQETRTTPTEYRKLYKYNL